MVVRVFDDAWLAQVREEILEPELAICDPHHHLWWRPESKYLLDDLLNDTGSGHHVTSTVFVECNSMYRAAGPKSLSPVGETEFVQGIAAMSASGGFGRTRVAKGIVSFADLTLGQGVREVLEAHQQAGTARFRGIRHAAGWHESQAIRNSHTDPPQGLMLRDDFREGMSVLDEMGLTFDAWFYHHQLDEFSDLARTFPNVTMILDHFAGPLGIGPYKGHLDQVFNDWKQDVAALTNCNNVYFKLGGINMKLNGFEWHKRDKPPSSDELVDSTAPYYDYCIDLFGVDRCMFESNFPVDKESCSYAVLWNAFKRIAEPYSEAEKAALFHDTAARTYNVPA